MTNRLLLALRTMQHLRVRQLAYQAVRRLQSRASTRLPTSAPPLADRAVTVQEVIVGWGPGNADERIARAEAVIEGRFDFVGQEERLETVDWLARPVGPLWTYNLHYFAYARDLAWAGRLTRNSRFARRFVELAQSWIEATAGGRGPGWEPYPLSVRIGHWIEALLLLDDAIEPADARDIWTSVFAQLSLLERRLEWHILANHLQKNLYAMVLGGLVFDGTVAQRWRTRHGALLWREVLEQVLPDGTHFERSPSYHALVLCDCLEALQLVEATGGAVPSAVRARLTRMLQAYGCMSRDDGTPLLLNDSAVDAAPTPAELRTRARQALDMTPCAPGDVWALPDAGYFGVRAATATDADGVPGASLVFDCGPLGPTYQPGHGHCDALTYLLELGGRAFIVDSGISGYDGHWLREYQRSTRAHNTVSIAGGEQSEMWATFRVARRARTANGGVAREGERVVFTGAVTPYFDAGRTHHRSITLGRGELEVRDTVDGAAVEARSFLHFHPDVTLTLHEDSATARMGALVAEISAVGCERLSCESGVRNPPQGWYAERFGRSVPAPVLTFHARVGAGRSFGYILRWRNASD